MVINKESDKERHVKFVSYDGKYPSLCMGTLTLDIDGETVTFGYDFSRPYNEGCQNYPSFWESGGSAYFTNNYREEHVETEEWLIDYSELPEKYQKYADEIDRIFNENVEFGCCGGCL